MSAMYFSQKLINAGMVALSRPLPRHGQFYFRLLIAKSTEFVQDNMHKFQFVWMKKILLLLYCASVKYFMQLFCAISVVSTNEWRAIHNRLLPLSLVVLRICSPCLPILDGRFGMSRNILFRYVFLCRYFTAC